MDGLNGWIQSTAAFWRFKSVARSAGGSREIHMLFWSENVNQVQVFQMNTLQYIVMLEG